MPTDSGGLLWNEKKGAATLATHPSTLSCCFTSGLMCRNHSFQFFPQFPNTLSPLVVFQDIRLVHVAQLARLPNIQLRLVELDEFRANLLDTIHKGTFRDRT